jgi:dihydrofolate synthase/folylpolyglutamate synthase
MGLERVEQLLSLLGDPHKKLRVVQVVGTNGKGTTAVALAAALSQADQSAGVYLSPHVLSYTERVMLGGAFVSEERFARAMGEAIEVADRHGVSASQFELLTAGAVKLFADEGLGWAVLEAGLGARHDATTAARPEAVVLTNVGLDHAEYLGDSVEEISHEKLASLSPGSVLVLGTDDPKVGDIARRRCAEADARLVEAPPGEAENPSPEPPLFVLRDVALGIRAAEELLGEKLGDEARGLVSRAAVGALPGRFEAHEVEACRWWWTGGTTPQGWRPRWRRCGRPTAGGRSRWSSASCETKMLQYAYRLERGGPDRRADAPGGREGGGS